MSTELEQISTSTAPITSTITAEDARIEVQESQEQKLGENINGSADLKAERSDAGPSEHQPADGPSTSDHDNNLSATTQPEHAIVADAIDTLQIDGSRTSTPPLSSSAPKKFSAVNVTKKFLSKSTAPPTTSKLGKCGVTGGA